MSTVPLVLSWMKASSTLSWTVFTAGSSSLISVAVSPLSTLKLRPSMPFCSRTWPSLVASLSSVFSTLSSSSSVRTLCLEIASESA